MGVYIPNMEKPKHCTECYFVCRDQCELQDNSYDYDTFKEQKKHCPLIEIDLVKCGECKHCEKRETAKHILINYCEAHGISILDTDYCNWGERRADDNTIKADK